MVKPDGIEVDPDIYTGKDTQDFYIEKTVNPEHSLLGDLIQHIDEYVETPKCWKTIVASIVLYVKEPGDDSDHRLFTIDVPYEPDDSDQDAYRKVKDLVLDMELIKVHASDEVVAVKNGLYCCDTDDENNSLGELTFCIYLKVKSVQ